MLNVEKSSPMPLKVMNFHSPQKRPRYVAPSASEIRALSLRDTLASCQRGALREKQFDMLRSEDNGPDVQIYASGDISLLATPCVSIVGTRDVSDDGRARARKLARLLAAEGITVVSGLAKGVDTAAHSSAVEAGGRTIAVIGTPLDKAYPAENASLQELIYRDHLLISPFRPEDRVYKGNFPKRNRVMAAISDATVIIEASDTSGTLHQAAECQRLNRWLFIARSVVDDASLSWPRRFIGKERVGVLNSISDITNAINRS